jgi:hypothetical protein
MIVRKIASAPRDGTMIFGICEDGRAYLLRLDDEGWRTTYGGHLRDGPTHWVAVEPEPVYFAPSCNGCGVLELQPHKPDCTTPVEHRVWQ